MNLKNI